MLLCPEEPALKRLASIPTLDEESKKVGLEALLVT